MKQFKFFPYLLLISALILSFCAAYFSVYGISSLFSGAIISVSIMAGALEVAKLVASSFLFRYWSKTAAFLKTYMLIGVIMLLFITSLGIFGYLSAAYQKSSTENKILIEHVEVVNNQKKLLSDRIDQSNKRIEFISSLRSEQEKRLSESLKNDEIAKNIIQLQEVQDQTSDLIKKSDADVDVENKKIQDYTEGISKFDDEISKLKIQSLEKKDITTFQFVADAIGMNINSVVKWFILSLIFVFDPMAISMLLAYNSLITGNGVLVEKEESNKEESVESISSDKSELKKEEGFFSKIKRKPFSRFYK